MPLNLYSDEVVSTICERLARGESLVEICRDDDLPSETMVYRWLAEKPVFREMYARARRRRHPNHRGVTPAGTQYARARARETAGHPTPRARAERRSRAH